MAQGNWRVLLDEHLYDMAIELQPIIDDVCMKLRSSVTAYEYANFVSEANGMKKVEKLVDSVKSRDLAVFNKFCEALEDCGHSDLARKLRGSHYIVLIVLIRKSSTLRLEHLAGQ